MSSPQSSPFLLVVVPFRAGLGQEHRADHLRVFLETMPGFLEGMRYFIVVVEQTPGGKFNRGGLLNAGVAFAASKGIPFSGVCFHDVDLIPDFKMRTAYERSASVNVHLARCWKRYDSSSYLGGALALTRTTVETINGFPNMFWGWGGEVDEVRRRLAHHRIPVEACEDGAYTDLENMSLEQKLEYLRANKRLKCSDKWEVRDGYIAARARGEAVEGLRQIAFRIRGTREITPMVVRLLVELQGPSK